MIFFEYRSRRVAQYTRHTNSVKALGVVGGLARPLLFDKIIEKNIVFVTFKPPTSAFIGKYNSIKVPSASLIATHIHQQQRDTH